MSKSSLCQFCGGWDEWVRQWLSGERPVIFWINMLSGCSIGGKPDSHSFVRTRIQSCYIEGSECVCGYGMIHFRLCEEAAT